MLREDAKLLLQEALMEAALSPDGRGTVTLPAQAVEWLVDAARRGSPLAVSGAFDPTVEGIAARLRSARIKAGYKRASHFAERVGVLPVTLRAHENGQNGFPRDTAKLYADALGVSVHWLLYGVEQ